MAEESKQQPFENANEALELNEDQSQRLEYKQGSGEVYPKELLTSEIDVVSQHVRQLRSSTTSFVEMAS
jgi:hypothetical protein